jgi:hypothetical protein
MGTIQQEICWCGMRKDLDNSGFTAPSGRSVGRLSVALTELIAIVGLVLSTIIAATAVTVGMAHADVVGNVIDNEGSLFTIALLLGMIFIGVGGYSALTLPLRRTKKH